MTNSFTPSCSSSQLPRRSLNNMRLPILPADLFNSDSISQGLFQDGVERLRSAPRRSQEELLELSRSMLDLALAIVQEDGDPQGPAKQ
mmetsp:Transcript_24472/g.59932  ORF Transcript_24472/g.59932 Transcript_24472/m.59932 type:complete len:88 (-) Transcript_24472:244-507(-)|eukprot:CAMPEP_0113618236 /NCGR_PEP_ID=MMETSP0017_2-20120614/9225_1 /TAXON_ID=2856 /ORGANISM="Cylindrotheca closterium" /LENGTH=87 /DNA_ID=CAMNT_0000527723 /DNA_START=47 /DNA_END=310 /DNA_ORIENTATION=+ /assembly_acc=CAM_ASM_000147